MGGAGLPFIVIVAVVLVLVAFVVFGGVVPWSKRQGEQAERLEDPQVASLEYVVPEGQDPGAILAALHREGFEAVNVEHSGVRRILISDDGGGTGTLRSRARDVIAHEAGLNTQGDPSTRERIAFTDE